MPRRRGSTNAGRRTTIDDGRCNGNKKPMAPHRAKVAPAVSPQSVNEAATPEATQSSDLGYLHKKFKKVAATFSTTPEPALPAADQPTDETSSTLVVDPAKKEEADSNGSSKSSSKGGRYVCHYCQHACAKPSVLEKHIRAHTNERPYPCVPCGFAFKTKSNLYKHCKSRTHVLKVEENGGSAHPQGIGSAGIIIDPVEGGSDDTSDDNVMLDDSDEGEPLVVVPPQPAEIIASSAPSTPEKFKTPYKPKFHNFKSSDDNLETPPTITDEGRPSPGFLHERISQIISKNQAIVETLDPIWPRRYVRQSSRDNKETAKSPRPDLLVSPPSIKKSGLAGRERSCSLSLVPHADQSTDSILAVPSVAPSTHRLLLQEDENQRKRCYSEGPAVTEIRHSVRNLLQQSPKPPRTEIFNPQNPEGSIIKDILLKSRGLLPANCDGKEAAVAVDPPTKMSSSFTVSALLNPSTTTRAKPVEFPHPHISLEPADDPAAASERPPKRPKVSEVAQSAPFPRPPVDTEMIRSSTSSSFVADRIRTSLPLFGGEVEIHDGPQRTVLRIDPAGYVESNRANGQSAAAESPSVVVVVTKASNNSGGLFRLQPQESRISVFPVIKTAPAETKSGDPASRGVVIIHQPSVPYIPGIPGPYSSSGWLPSSVVTSVTVSHTTTPTTACTVVASTQQSRPVPSITVHPPAASVAPHPEERTDSGFDDEDPSTQASPKFLRPNSLSLQPGTFNLKKSNMAGLDRSGQPNMLCVSGAGMTLISPETPRPRKLFRQLYLNGHAYTYLGLKCSTRVYFCCLSRAQPMYVPHHPKLSMYSQWKTRAPASAGPPGLEASSPTQTMSLYDSRQRPTTTTTAQSTDHGRMILTHSSYWTNRDRPTTTHFKLEVAEDVAIEIPPVAPPPQESRPPDQVISPTAPTKPVQPKRVRIFAGGYKSTEDYTYVRGRGRGRYVCEECGIRCKKPSMLKKHIRTHTDLRPYTCRQCNFSFKTKGNLTKHMKSKAHHKKCTELGIVPVPTTVDEANIDEDSLARQETLKKMKLAGGSGNEGDSDLDDDDDDDEDDEEDEEVEGEEEEDETEEDPPAVATKLLPTGQFEDAAEPVREEREQEVARSLLDLGVIAPAGCKPTTYPYASHFHPAEEEQQQTSVEMKEEPQAPSPVCKPQQPMDLSTSTASSSALLASIYSPIVSETAARRGGLSPENSVQPATSGMLQAYLTEKALKEGLMKRHQVKLMTPPSVVVENPVVTLFPNPCRTDNKSGRSEFVVPLSSTSAAIPTSVTAYKLTDDGKTACSICNKVFTKPSQLRLHINIHYFERPFRCEACAVSFRTKGHLQKHKRSVTHFNKVNMNLTFGTPSTENPRPFKCSDCMIAFRIHGHLAKHLRSKMHIMKLECLGKLPFGTYAEMERSGINLNEIDTTDCHNSLESLQSLAHRLYKQDPSKIQQWQQEAQVVAEANLRERTISESSEEFSDVADDELDEDGEDSDGLPDGAGVEEAPPRKSTPVETLPAQPEMSHPPRAVSPDAARKAPPPPVMYCSACGDSCVSMEAFQSHVMEKHRPLSPPTTRTPFKASPPAAPESPAKLAPSNIQPDVGRIVNLAMESRRSPSRVMETPKPGPPWNRGPGDLQYAQPRGFYGGPPPHSSSTMWPPPRQPTIGDLISLGNPLSAIPPQWHQDPAAMAWIASRHMMLPMTGHPPTYTTPHHSGGHHGAHTTNGGAMQPRLYSPTSSSSIAANDDVVFPCELCGKSFNAKETLRQHMLAHAQPRPFVCEFCDAGFTTQKHLESHLVLHRPRTS